MAYTKLHLKLKQSLTQKAVPEKNEGWAGGSEEGKEELVPGQGGGVEQRQGGHQGLAPLLPQAQGQVLLVIEQQ